ncbi:MAG TPA: tetratricopeptide repeat protein, partial [Longimicrobiales bacterium]|nr:tetratricopeptide repeat protein [Longimicrobiales bacterium]
MSLGAYDFGEWEMNELARQLALDGKVREAVAMLVLNEEFHATSFSIPLEIGRLQERLGDTAAAIAAYRRVLERAPDNPAARARLTALGGIP